MGLLGGASSPEGLAVGRLELCLLRGKSGIGGQGRPQGAAGAAFGHRKGLPPMAQLLQHHRQDGGDRGVVLGRSVLAAALLAPRPGWVRYVLLPPQAELISGPWGTDAVAALAPPVHTGQVWRQGASG